MNTTEILERARTQLAELIGRPTDSVSGLDQADDGWSVTVDVVELSRIPSSTDVLASYEVTLDADGDVTGYHRVARFHRSDVHGTE